MIKKGKQVKITKGKHKGKSGVVANATGDFVDVKVPDEDILLSVNKDQVMLEAALTMTFGDFLKEGEVVQLKVPAKEEMKKIMDWKIGGNAGQDYHLMDAIHNFLMSDEPSMDDKIIMIKKLDKVMGLNKPNLSAKDVTDYMKAG